MKKLFIILVGCKPQARNIEQHDVMFAVLETIDEVTQELLQTFWSGGHTLHIDGYMEVSHVAEYAISVSTNPPAKEQEEKLYFVNLGGYRKNEFEEFHKKLLIVANKQSEVTSVYTKDPFYLEGQGVGQAMISHVDDQKKMGMALEDIVVIDSKITDYYLHISKTNSVGYPKMIMGYLKI